MKLKTFGERSLSTLLFYALRAITIGYIIFFILIVLAIVTKSFEIVNNEFIIKIPFTDSVIKGNYETKVFLAITIFLIFYTVFFYLASNIFKTFKSKVLFTKKASRYLLYFTFWNLLYAVTELVIIGILYQRMSITETPEWMLHLILGIFSWFIASIFKEGTQIQQENELTI
ncbi:DUF2975 domain-containing protein [Aquimarina brevivitae]|uniref:DUF2975 family protein n=1 Tax=Aquimarina brevivitae TaxID=323412 RepID=A0A4V2F7E8_9FLAO|nr:DUF2975 domain-containing protein [Aquimarina brevivitae]RZS99569.1 DUF2975 family protein [Aquimarina brevivitae]